MESQATQTAAVHAEDTNWWENGAAASAVRQRRDGFTFNAAIVEFAA